MLRVRLDRLLEAEESVVDCNRLPPRFLLLRPFSPWAADVLIDRRLCICEPLKSHDHIDVISGLSALQSGLNVIVGSESARDEFGRFLFVHRLNSHRFKDRYTERIATHCQPFPNGFRSYWRVYSFEAVDL